MNRTRCQCERSSLKFGQIKLISPRFRNGFRGVGRHLVFLLLPTALDQLTSSAETEYSLFETQTAVLCELEIKVMPILRFLHVCICTVLKRVRTEEHCQPMADKIKWIGWRTPIGRHVIPACVPIGWRSLHFVSTHFTVGASQNFVQKGIFSWAEFS